MNFVLLLFPSLLSALLAYLVRPYRVAVGWVNAGLSLVSLGAALAFAVSESGRERSADVRAERAAARR